MPLQALLHVPLQVILSREELSRPGHARVFTPHKRTIECDGSSMHLIDMSVHMCLRAKAPGTLWASLWSSMVSHVTPGRMLDGGMEGRRCKPYVCSSCDENVLVHPRAVQEIVDDVGDCPDVSDSGETVVTGGVLILCRTSDSLVLRESSLGSATNFLGDEKTMQICLG
jgi:hypothetical protein